jgi:hypothetical protein
MALAISEQDRDVVVLNELVTVRREGFQTVSVFLEGTPRAVRAYWARSRRHGRLSPGLPGGAREAGSQYELVATLRSTNIRLDLPYFPVPVFIQYDDRDVTCAATCA